MRTAHWALSCWLALASAFAGDLVAAPITFGYDSNGNLVSRSEDGVQWNYVYDAENRLREARRDGVLLESYQYDPAGRRIRRVSSQGMTRFVWDRQEILLETDHAGNTIASYALGPDGPVSRTHLTEGTVFYLVDALGSPVTLSRSDSSVAARYSYDAWGNLRRSLGECTNTLSFTGYQFDEPTGLYYAGARYYDPAAGRFVSQDPVAGGIFEPPSLHSYLYAYANPTIYVDPDGRCVGELQNTAFCQAIAKGIAFVIGGDPEAVVEKEIQNREKVVAGRREFRAQTGQNPGPNDVVWSENGRALTSGFQELDTSGRIEPDHAEWAVVGAGIGTRMAVAGARAAGASTTEQVLAGAAQLGDEAVAELTVVSARDAADIARGLRNLSDIRESAGDLRPPESMTVVESADLGVVLVPGAGYGAHSAKEGAQRIRWVDEGGDLRAAPAVRSVDSEWFDGSLGGSKRTGRSSSQAAASR